MGSKGTPASTRLAVAERRRRALELRRAGVGYEDIVRLHPELGYKSRGACATDVKRALEQTITEPARDLIQLELDRLDRMLLGLWNGAAKGNVAAVDRVLRIMERRARYQGLDHADQNGAVLTVEASKSMLTGLMEQLQRGDAHDDGDVAGATGVPEGINTAVESVDGCDPVR